jgi:hypothetical protein
MAVNNCAVSYRNSLDMTIACPQITKQEQALGVKMLKKSSD